MLLKKNFLSIFFSLISIYAILNIFHSSISFDWTFEDWLINYEGGFVRRGLSGEIISKSSFVVSRNVRMNGKVSVIKKLIFSFHINLPNIQHIVSRVEL